jgi:hypothetical protein
MLKRNEYLEKDYPLKGDFNVYRLKELSFSES